MRAKLAKSLRALFEARLAACFPQIRPEKAKLAPSGSRCYAIAAGPGITWFIQLVILDDQDQFAIEIAWSRTGAYPAKRAKAEPRGAVPLNAEAFVDLAKLWLGPPPPASPDGGGVWVDLWWHVVPRTRHAEVEQADLGWDSLPSSHSREDVPPGRLEALVDHAIGVLARDGVPYLRRAAESQDLRVDWELASAPPLPPHDVDPALLPAITHIRRVRRTPDESEEEVRALKERATRLLNHRAVQPVKLRKGKKLPRWPPSRPSSSSR